MKFTDYEKRNRYHRLVGLVGQYVYDHIDEDIGIDVIASEVGVSKFHLNRIFQSLTGYTLGQFIQSRRMGFAYEMLAKGNMSVIDVALAVGYNSHASFTRTFSKVFHLTPIEVVHDTAPPYTVPNLSKVAPVGLIEPELVELPSRKLVGLYGSGFKEQGFSEVADSLYRQLNKELTEIGLNGLSGLKHVGASIDNPWRCEQEQCRYFAGVDLDYSDKTENLSFFEWASGIWAKFEHRGAHRYMWQTISQVYSSWVIPNEIEIRNAAIVQVYVNSPNDTEASELLTELYFPLTSN